MADKIRPYRLTRIIPERLREARLARGLTIAELAEHIEVTRQSVSQYELGQSSPSGEVLARIIKVLNFPLDYFCNPLDKETPASVTFFRSLSSATKRSREMIKQREKWVEKIFIYAQKYLDFPEVNLPVINVSAYGEKIDDDQIERIAETVRKHWGLGQGPISDVILLLEKQGIIVTRFSFEDLKMDACSQWRGNRPFIFLSSDKESAVRTRFDAAHELAHLLLHTWIDGEEQLANKKVLNRIEKEANRFAGAFLLPRDSFSKEVISTSLEHFVSLKRRWKVSIQAMIHRCEELGILTENQILYLWKQLNRLGYKKREPLDDELEPENPRILRQAIIMLLENKVSTVGEILDFIKLLPPDIEALCGLPSGTLESKSKVIPLRFKKHQ
ncbi:ImmA/IrrE family metallo-endopeptidase [Desulfofundulus sp. TPOSR]|uniref:helix-turn-helix domain-containing protein n=1 Tax=Desulfofundulus sp. TPOSR TaxID=2714340 RepID=UPI0014072997|nr:XRE family transcriptional regulator [Desulfofundulus sp. TPOSR]NHM28034.1 ImmA/IrrE family metallo-endopeptidase [Desulfofundulus sp. TPOSR]